MRTAADKGKEEERFSIRGHPSVSLTLTLAQAGRHKTKRTKVDERERKRERGGEIERE